MKATVGTYTIAGTWASFIQSMSEEPPRPMVPRYAIVTALSGKAPSGRTWSFFLCLITETGTANVREG